LSRGQRYHRENRERGYKYLAEAENLRDAARLENLHSGRWKKNSIPGRAERNTSIGWPLGTVPRVNVKMVFTVIAFNLCQLCTLKNAKVI
jgi:hypothetical protein